MLDEGKENGRVGRERKGDILDIASILHQIFVVVQLVMPDSLQPHRLKHARFPCPSLSP